MDEKSEEEDFLFTNTTLCILQWSVLQIPCKQRHSSPPQKMHWALHPPNLHEGDKLADKNTLSQALSLLAMKFCFLLASQGKKGVTTQHREESFAEGGGRKGLYKPGTRMQGWRFELVPLSSFPISYLSVSSLFDYHKRNLKSAFTDSQINV